MRLVRAAAAGSLFGVLASSVLSCSRAEAPVAAGGDTTAAIAVAQPANAGATMLRGECTACHARAHDGVLRRGPASSAQCSGCHASSHDAIQALYAGVSHGAALRPDPMFVARVACAACHTDTTFAVGPGDARIAAINRTCTGCHGPRFARLLPMWTGGMAERTRMATEYVSRASTDPRLANIASARARVVAAQSAVAVVRTAGGLHNVRGADALLRAAIDSAGAAYGVASVAAPARPALGPDPARVSCVRCHYGIEAARGPAFGKSFDHGAHIVRADVACARCHTAADYFVGAKHDVDPRHGKTTLTATSCNECHHAPTLQIACSGCHAVAQLARTIPVTMPLHLQPPNAPSERAVNFRHANHSDVACASCHTSRTAVSTVAACTTCHETHHRQASQCAACHGAGIRTAHKSADHLTCTRCHARATVAQLTFDRTFCVSCHTDRGGHQPARECSTCHMQRTPSELRALILSGTG